MATLLPPPKRVKLTHGTAQVPEKLPEAVEPAPTVVVQFVSEDDGKTLGPAVSLPADLAREALEGLVNSLGGNVSSNSLSSSRHFTDRWLNGRQKTRYPLPSTSHYLKLKRPPMVAYQTLQRVSQ